MTVLAFTGHRPQKLGGFGDPAVWRILQLAISVVYQEKPTEIITGMALGWDQAVAAAAVTYGIPFIAAVPFEGQEKAWPKQSQTRYFNLLSKAADVVYVSPGGYSSAKMHARNHWMVDNCDRLAALWNGGLSGGTFACVQYAVKRGKPFENYWRLFLDSRPPQGVP